MDAIVVCHVRIEEDARQQEGHEARAVRGSQPRKNPMKFE
jgi:hypothetical protein